LTRWRRRLGAPSVFLAREAIIHHLDDLEDYHLALVRLRRDGKRMSLDELDAEIGAEKR
jgi:RHH-type transcriptional regulator, rel operon repressor / antitoxin RelB